LFAWVRRKQRNNVLKLLRQNFLAFEELQKFKNLSVASGLTGSDQTDHQLDTCRKLIDIFTSNKKLSADETQVALDLNRQARIIYDHMLDSRKVARELLGSSPEIEPSFDKKFAPLLGWKADAQNWRQGNTIVGNKKNDPSRSSVRYFLVDGSIPAIETEPGAMVLLATDGSWKPISSAEILSDTRSPEVTREMVESRTVRRGWSMPEGLDWQE
jgi:hypothetical protein